MSKKSAAAQETIAELDTMESNLRRLGLGTDAAADPVHSNSSEATEAYMARIRATKDERRKLKQEKELRQFLISAKESDNELYLSRVAEAKRVQTIVDSAPDLLKEENKRAAEVVKARTQQSAEMAQRAEQLRKGQQLQQELLAERSKVESHHHHSYSHLPLPSASDCRPESLGTLSAAGSVKSGLIATLHHDNALDFCEELVNGIVNLSVLVSDNRHLPELDVSGEPVQRLIQDLGVTQWSEWVRQCLHPDAGATATVGDDNGADDATFSAQGMAGSPSSAGADAEEALRERMLTELCDLAKDHVTAVSHHDAARTQAVEHSAVLEALATFLQENERVHKVACEAIRRQFSEEDDDVTRTATAGQVVEEVVPRWAQRMPPAATFLNGDDLSGARLLAEKIEHAARHGESTTGAPAGAPTDDPAAPVAATAVKSGKKASTPPTPVGVVVRDGGVTKIFVTPRTLTGQLAVATGGASGGRTQLGSAGRSRTAGKGGAGAGGGGGGARRASIANGDDDERREMDVLSDLLVRELLSLHTHNVHALTNGAMPLPPSMIGVDTLASASPPALSSPVPMNTAAPAKPSGGGGTNGVPTTGGPKARSSSRTALPPARTPATPTTTPTTATAVSTTEGVSTPKSSTSTAAVPLPLQALILVGFPESDIFYRLLCDKLRGQIDAIELEMLSEERRLANALADGAVAAASNSPAGKSKAPHPPSRTKSSKTANAKGSSSDLTAQRVLSETSDTLLKSKVFPPLCILGFFLEYNVATRHTRLQDAVVRFGVSEVVPPPATPSTPSAAGTAPLVDPFTAALPSSSTAAAGDPQPTVPAALAHAVFAPVAPLSAGLASSPLAGGSSHINRERPSTAHQSFSSSSTPSSGGRGLGYGHASAVHVGELWSTEQIQRELLEQDRRMRRWQQTWCGCFSRVSMSSFRKAAALIVKQGRRRSGEKSAIVATGALPSPRKSSHAVGPVALSVSGSSNIHEASTLESGTAAAAVILPKVLFFFHREDVSDMDLHTEVIANELAEKEPWQWLAHRRHESTTHCDPLSDAHESAETTSPGDAATAAALDTLQTRWAAFIVSRVVDSVHGSSTRVLTNEALVPQQLPPPLRLGDYRLPRDAITRLVSTFESHTRHPLAAIVSRGKLPGAVSVRHAASSSPPAAGMPRPLAAEMDLMRAFSMYVAQTLDLLRTGVFGNDLWSHTQLMSTVAHYTSIDDDYNTAKSALLDYSDSTRRRLYARTVVLLRLVVDAALEATADALAYLSDALLTHCFTDPAAVQKQQPQTPECSSSVLSSGSLNGGAGGEVVASSVPSTWLPHETKDSKNAAHAAARAQILSRLRKLTEGEVQALVSPFFVQESAAEAQVAMGAALEPYAEEVHRSATSYLVEVLERAEHAYAADKVNSADPGDGAAGPSARTARPRTAWAAILPSMVARVLARTFYLPASLAALPDVSSTGTGSTHKCTHGAIETRAADAMPMTGVAASFVHAVVTVQVLVSCFDVAVAGSRTWLEIMYRLALHVPAGHTYPDTCRPPSVAALMSPPLLEAATRGDVDARAWTSAVRTCQQAIDDAEEESLVWQQCRLELFLADMSLYNSALLSQDAFVHCAALHQLRDLCWYTEYKASALAEAIDFSFNEDEDGLSRESEKAHWHTLSARCPALCTAFTLIGDLKPLPPDGPATVAQLHAVFEQQSEQMCSPDVRAITSPSASSPCACAAPPTCTAKVDVRQWCCDVIRYSAAVETCGPQMDITDLAVPLARPSTRELRAVVLTLPFDVVVQTTLASAATDRGETYMTSAAPSSLISAGALDATAWSQAHWWRDLAPRQHRAVQWSLLRALTARYVLTTAYGVPSLPTPRLPTVLHWLARASCGVCLHRSSVSYMDAMYHCLAALQYRLQVAAHEKSAADGHGSSLQTNTLASVDPHAVAPLAADDVVVRASDFAYYLAGGSSDCAPVPLATDALLLVQSAGDGATGVTLPLLLASQWGRTLMQRHGFNATLKASAAPTAARA